MDLQEIRDNITRRRNKIFLLMEEVRRLRIQHKIKSTEKGLEDVAEVEEVPEYTSAIPLLAPITEATMQQYFRCTCLIIMAGIVLFGGLIAPVDTWHVHVALALEPLLPWRVERLLNGAPIVLVLPRLTPLHEVRPMK